MTKEEIIDIAREAGFKVAPFKGGKSKGEISVFDYGDVEIIKELTRFSKLVASKEREECAKVCDGRKQEGLSMDGCAASIRARRNA